MKLNPSLLSRMAATLGGIALVAGCTSEAQPISPAPGVGQPTPAAQPAAQPSSVAPVTETPAPQTDPDCTLPTEGPNTKVEIDPCYGCGRG